MTDYTDYDDALQARLMLEEKMQARHNLYLARVAACKQLREQGWTLRRIGVALEISHEWVRQLLQYGETNP